MQKGLLLLFSLFPFFLSAQSSSQWIIGTETEFFGMDNISQEENRILTTAFELGTQSSFAYGLMGGYQLNPNFALLSGISFSKNKINYTRRGLTFGGDIDPNSGTIRTSFFENQTAYTLIQIPLRGEYSPRIGERAHLLLNIDFGAAFFIDDQSSSTLRYEDDLSIHPEDQLFSSDQSIVEDFSLYYRLGLGIRFKPTETISLSFNPFYRIYTKKIKLDNTPGLQNELMTNLGISAMAMVHF